jgi:hypothetical protein
VAPVVHGQQTVRVTRRDQSLELLEAPHVEGDSLTGFGRTSARRVAIPRPDVARVEQWRRENGRTTLFVFGIVAAFVGLNPVFSDGPQK